MKNDMTTLSPGPHGFHITFPDGFVLSCQYGIGNYCQNQGTKRTGDIEGWTDHKLLNTTNTMEVAVMNPNGDFVVLAHDVAGWVPIGNLPQLMEAVKSHDWDKVCLLCGEVANVGNPKLSQDALDELAKFPEKGVDYA